MPPESGCRRCIATGAAEAWDRTRDLVIGTDIVAESHFRISVRGCPYCAQNYVWVFCETIDWADGDDPQEWLLVPVTAVEAQRFIVAGEPGAAEVLGNLVPRHYLRRRFGRQDDVPTAQWVTGAVILPPHD
jgi:hypothetical protein